MNMEKILERCMLVINIGYEGEDDIGICQTNEREEKKENFTKIPATDAIFMFMP